jgi:hypothetical protein
VGEGGGDAVGGGHRQRHLWRPPPALRWGQGSIIVWIGRRCGIRTARGWLDDRDGAEPVWRETGKCSKFE